MRRRDPKADTLLIEKHLSSVKKSLQRADANLWTILDIRDLTALGEMIRELDAMIERNKGKI